MQSSSYGSSPGHQAARAATHLIDANQCHVQQPVTTYVSTPPTNQQSPSHVSRPSVIGQPALDEEAGIEQPITVVERERQPCLRASFPLLNTVTSLCRPGSGAVWAASCSVTVAGFFGLLGLLPHFSSIRNAGCRDSRLEDFALWSRQRHAALSKVGVAAIDVASAMILAPGSQRFVGFSSPSRSPLMILAASVLQVLPRIWNDVLRSSFIAPLEELQTTLVNEQSSFTPYSSWGHLLLRDQMMSLAAMIVTTFSALVLSSLSRQSSARDEEARQVLGTTVVLLAAGLSGFLGGLLSWGHEVERVRTATGAERGISNCNRAEDTLEGVDDWITFQVLRQVTLAIIDLLHEPRVFNDR